MHTTHYAASEATVFGWADPITGLVFETVYDQAPADARWRPAVYGPQQHGWVPYSHPDYFAGSFPCGASDVTRAHIATRGHTPDRDYLRRTQGDLAQLIDY